MNFGRTCMSWPHSTPGDWGSKLGAYSLFHSVDRQGTQALNLNPICLPVHLQFCFWAVWLHGMEIWIVSTRKRVGHSSQRREFGLHGNRTWVHKDLSSCPASTLKFPLICSFRLPFSELQHLLSVAQILSWSFILSQWAGKPTSGMGPTGHWV